MANVTAEMDVFTVDDALSALRTNGAWRPTASGSYGVALRELHVRGWVTLNEFLVFETVVYRPRFTESGAYSAAL